LLWEGRVVAGPNFSYTGFTETFADEFNNISLWNGTTGTWQTNFYNGDRTLFGNGELETYMDPSYQGSSGHALGVDPFSVSNGILTITAAPTDPSVLPFVGNIPYTSGLITTESSFAQLYGYFEIRAKVPQGQGVWPAFWLMPLDKSWPPEIDAMEVLGQKTTEVFHGSRAVDATLNTGGSYQLIDSADGFHTYGVLWEPSGIKWYIDGAEVGTAPNSSDKPMYMLTNLAVGGLWPGSPDATTPFPADYQVDYIHAFTLDGGPGVPVPVGSPSPTPTPAPSPAPAPSPTPAGAQTGGAVQVWHLGADAASLGTAKNEYFDGGGSVHTMTGGAGDDSYVVYASTDQIVENPNEGIDGVSSFVNYVLPANVENLTLLSSPAVSATGNALANLIHGNGGDNVIDGAGGADVLTGGGGNDSFVMKQGYGALTIADWHGGAGVSDTVQLIGFGINSFATVQQDLTQNGADSLLMLGPGDSITFKNTAVGAFAADDFGFAAPSPSPAPAPAPAPTPSPTPTPTGAFTPTPIEARSYVAPNSSGIAQGSSGDDDIFATGDNQTLIGNGGNDVFHLGTHTGTIVSESGTGISEVSTWAGQYALPTGISNLTGAGSSAHTLTGNAAANVITGNTGNDVLNGGGGNDELVGAGGADVYKFAVGGGQDMIVNGSGAGAASGELDLGAGIASNQLWLVRSANDLQIDRMGSSDQVTIAGWYNGTASQLQAVKTASGAVLDAQIGQLVQAMANFQSANPGFNPTLVAQAPNDPSLQSAIAASWHA
jgi:beta-glucanase (GH16 family)